MTTPSQMAVRRTINSRCVICKHTDRRNAVELMWNGGMSGVAISDLLGGTPNPATILKHLKEHSLGGATREVDVEPEAPVRERILRLQRMQLDEIERRIALAKMRADETNEYIDAQREKHEAAGEDYDRPNVDWSSFTDILGKDMQSAIGSILKTQGLSDKREKVQGELKLGLFEAMTAAGHAPLSISGGKQKQLTAPQENDDDDALAEALYPDDIGAK